MHLRDAEARRHPPFLFIFKFLDASMHGPFFLFTPLLLNISPIEPHTDVYRHILTYGFTIFKNGGSKFHA